MTLTDDEWVGRVEASIAHWRARNAAFQEAVSRITVEPVHEVVRARFDSNGTLIELEIDPSALSDYTNTELEDIITEVLQKTRTQLHAQVMELFETYMAPGHARFDPNVLGEPYVDLPG
jgi:DNA-binding protein YbaB